jgi:type II secretory pathway predicted ATPase ExeA
MIRSFFGISKNPFSTDAQALLEYQQEVFDILKVHSRQGGFCLLMGEPGTGKTVIKETIKHESDKTMVVVTIARTLHTYSNTIKILCQAFNIEYSGSHFKCEKRLIEEAFNLYRQGKCLITIIDDAHLMEMDTLRKLRLLFEDFPKNHNIILIGQPGLLNNLSLKVNDDIKSRITYSTIMKKLNPDQIEAFIFDQLDQTALAHNVFTDDALSLIIRSSEGYLRKVRNLCLSCLLECARRQSRTVDLENVNSVLMQPHWRNEYDME